MSNTTVSHPRAASHAPASRHARAPGTAERAAAASACPFHAFFRRDGETPARFGVLAYGVFAYLLFVGTFVYAIAFTANWFVPKSIDSGEPIAAIPSLLVNTALLSIFVVQHTIMARPAFKRWWTTIVPASIERSTFVVAASASLILVFAFWKPLPATVWRVDQPIAAGLLTALCAFGAALALYSSFVINHFDLFGLRQVWARFVGRAWTPVPFQLRGPYRLVRHPLMVGFLFVFWATPHMSVGHLFFAIMCTGYILLGTWFEERDLVAEHGEEYLAYRRAVRGLVPLPKRGSMALGRAASAA